MLNQILSFFQRKILRNNQVRWNYKYARGDWEGLKNPTLNNRLIPASDFLQSLKPNAIILEIGCGEGVFQQILKDESYQFFEGTDISDWAINHALKYENEKTVFFAGDMETYLPQKEQYDAIVITDSIYYSKKPLNLLVRYEKYLKEDGIFIITMNDYKHSNEVWTTIEKRYLPSAQRTETNEFGTWVCKVYLMENKRGLEK
ncbi:MAG: methyltransferase domain-containing protein [Bacteroidota bacterium]|jgi:2-polyprenyl-6-hydroxyphenyl methylase/3-demethylubiquinone-9 3-methyltransferase